MVVHGVAAGEELLEAVGTDGDHQRQADRRPDRVAAADPVPEAEGALERDAERRHLVERGRHGGEMRTHRRLAELVDDPAPRACRIGHRLDGRKGLRRDQEERPRRVQPGERIADMGAVDVRDEMEPRPIVESVQRPGRHGRAEIRSADADIDHVGEAGHRCRRSRRERMPVENSAMRRSTSWTSGTTFSPLAR